MASRHAVPAVRDGPPKARVPLLLKSTNAPLQTKAAPVKSIRTTRLGSGLTGMNKVVPAVPRVEKFTIHEDCNENSEESASEENRYSIIQQLEKQHKTEKVEKKEVRKPLVEKRPAFYVHEDADEAECPLPSSSCYATAEKRFIASESEYFSAQEETEVCSRSADESSYAPPRHMMVEMFSYMRERETKVCARPRYLEKQKDLTENMRSILIDWLNDVCVELALENETLHLAVSLIDRQLSINLIERGSVQLVGTCALMIAAKYEEIYPPELKQLVYMTDDTYTEAQLLKMERRMLNALRFDVSAPTCRWFVSHIGNYMQLDKETLDMAHYLIDLSLLNYEYVQRRRSMVACAALCASARLLREEELWSEEFVAFTSIPLTALSPIVASLIETYKAASSSEFHSMYDKYACDELSCVSTVSLPSLIE